MERLTLIGLYNYDNSLFDYLSLPDGIDKDTAKDVILEENGEFEVLYPNFEFMQGMIAVWSKKYEWTISRWIRAINVEYNPLENYDRTEIEETKATDNRTNDFTQNVTGSSSSEQTNNGTVSVDVSAYDNADAYTPKDRTSSGDNTSGSSNTAESTTGNQNSTGNNDVKRNLRSHGNIGVTTSQQMLESELEIAKWNIYHNIAMLFKVDFCIGVY